MAKKNQTPARSNAPLTWNPEDKITITGIEFHALNRALELFEVAIMAKNSILSRMVKDGIAKHITQEAMSEEIVPNDVTTEPTQENTPVVEESSEATGETSGMKIVR